MPKKIKMPTPPIGWIPPEFRKRIYRNLTDEELESVNQSIWQSVYDKKTKKFVKKPLPLSELNKIKVIVEVVDSRIK